MAEKHGLDSEEEEVVEEKNCEKPLQSGLLGIDFEEGLAEDNSELVDLLKAPLQLHLNDSISKQQQKVDELLEKFSRK